MRMAKIIVAFLLLSRSVIADEAIPKWQSELVSSSIQSVVIQIRAEQKGLPTATENKNFVGLIHALALIDTNESFKALVDLSDYYLGSAAGEDLTALITRKGTEIKPYLLDKKRSAPSCLYKELCLSKKERNQRLDRWIRLIDKGVKVELIP